MRHAHSLNRKGVALAALVLGLAAALAALLATQLGGPSRAVAADHRDAPGLTPPGGDVRVDINDVYAFESPSDESRTVLMLTVNGLTPGGTPAYFGRATPGVGSSKRISYYLDVDNDGDAVADVTYRVRFGKVRRGAQSYEVRRLGAGGNRVLVPMGRGRTTRFGSAPRVASGGGIRAFAGMSDDPFFFDLPGFVNIAKGLDALGLDADPSNDAESFIGCTGERSDAFAGTNVSTIAIDVPDSQLTAGGSSTVGVWARTTVGGEQVDRMGRPAIATVFIPNNPIPPDTTGDSQKSAFNKAAPEHDQASFRGEVVNTLQTLFSLNDAGGPLGGTDDASDDAGLIGGLADILLPDVLTYDTTMSDGFLNGRRLADDVIDAELELVTEGLVTTDCVPGNDKAFSNAFPHVATPHR